MRAASDLTGDVRRAELGDFLRRRRAELTIEMAGLPTTLRRRTPGLRREEVAELADISTAAICSTRRPTTKRPGT